MLPNPFHRATYLTGATAVGKTAVAVQLARRLNAEIIALDSMTLYRGLDVGTAKPSLEDRHGIPHHLLDILEPWQNADLALYRNHALHAVLDIEARGKLPLFVGGTPLYLKALLRGLFEGPAANANLRAELEAEAQRLGRQALHARLAALDPTSAARLQPQDLRRVVRALEVVTLTGRPLSTLQIEHNHPAPPDVHVFALDRPRPILHNRINLRVHDMIKAGLVDEVQRLLDHPQGLGHVPAQAVGYREVADLLAGNLSLAAAVDRIQARTRQFAKRQSTWFRSLDEVQILPVTNDEPAQLTADRLVRLIKPHP